MIRNTTIHKKKSHSAIGKPHPKQQFTLEEDLKLQGLVQQCGTKNWELISQLMGNRNERQCKERWTKYLSPDLNNSPWTADEDRLLVYKIQELGQKWVKISKFFDKRTDANLKNRWNVLQRRAKLYGGDILAAINTYSTNSSTNVSSPSTNEDIQSSIQETQEEFTQPETKPSQPIVDQVTRGNIFDPFDAKVFDFMPFDEIDDCIFF